MVGVSAASIEGRWLILSTDDQGLNGVSIGAVGIDTEMPRVQIPIEMMREFADLVLRSELVAASRQVLGGPPELAVRRAVELASVVLEADRQGPK